MDIYMVISWICHASRLSRSAPPRASASAWPRSAPSFRRRPGTSAPGSPGRRTSATADASCAGTWSGGFMGKTWKNQMIYRNIENIWGIWKKTCLKTFQSPCFHSLRSSNIAREVFDFHDIYRGSSHSNTMLDYWRDPEGKDLQHLETHFFTNHQ